MSTMTLMFVLAMTTLAFAIAIPTAGDFAFDAYDITVNRILNGPIGFAIGVLAIAFGCRAAIQTEIFPAVAAFIAGAILLNADDVVASFGMLI